MSDQDSNPKEPGASARRLSVEFRSIDSLKPYEKNSRVHSPDQVERLAESIKRFGFNAPILILEDGTIVAGHGRLAAATLVGLNEVPTIVLPHLTLEEARAYCLADNRIGDLAGWDEQLLREELEDLDQELAGAAGFTEDEIEALTGEEEIVPREEEPENIDTSCKCPRCGHRFELSDS